MPKCSYCNKTFKDRQGLGNHMRKHIYDSDDDLSSSQNQSVCNYSYDWSLPTNERIELDHKIHIKQNIINYQKNSIKVQRLDTHVTGISNSNSSNKKSIALDIISEKDSVVFDENCVAFDKDSVAFDEESVVFDEESVAFDEESAVSDDESAASDLSYTTNVSINEYTQVERIPLSK